MKDLFGLTKSQGRLTNMLRQAVAQLAGGRNMTLAARRRARVVAGDETGLLIERTNSFYVVLRCAETVVHHVAFTRGTAVVRDIMGGHRPDVCLSDRYAVQQSHGQAHQKCLVHHLADVAYALKGGDEALALGFTLWLGSAFGLPEAVTTLAAATTCDLTSAPGRHLPRPRQIPDLHAHHQRGRAHQQRLRARPPARHDPGKGRQRLSLDLEGQRAFKP